MFSVKFIVLVDYQVGLHDISPIVSVDSYRWSLTSSQQIKYFAFSKFCNFYECPVRLSIKSLERSSMYPTVTMSSSESRILLLILLILIVYYLSFKCNYFTISHGSGVSLLQYYKIKYRSEIQTHRELSNNNHTNKWYWKVFWPPCTTSNLVGMGNQASFLIALWLRMAAHIVNHSGWGCHPKM